MCIALISTAHPKYQLILIDNRDEFLKRPTALAAWWPEPDSNVLGGRDLLRSAQGTWLGVTTEGRIAVLTNFREDGVVPEGAISRGVIIRAFLTDETLSDTAAFVKSTVLSGTAKHAGGFSLVCGKIGEPLAVISNRAKDEDDIPWIAPNEPKIVGLSNAAYSDHSWPKVQQGQQLMHDAIEESMRHGEGEDKLIERLLGLLSTDTLPRQEEGVGLETHIHQLRKTIFVPAIGHKPLSDLPADEVAAAKKNEKVEVVGGKTEDKSALGVSGLYGTQKQTVVLADHDGNVKFFERTLYDNDANPVRRGEGDVDFTFKIKA